MVLLLAGLEYGGLAIRKTTILYVVLLLARGAPYEEDTALSRTRGGRFDTKTLPLRSASAPFLAYRRAIGTVFGLLS